MDRYNVFLSWSGERSHRIAEYFRDNLPTIIQACVPWMSDRDIDKGARGLGELAKILGSTKVGITFLTANNVREPWILYEAGALSKTIDERSRLCTYLLPGLNQEDVEAPLGMFQWTKADMDETWTLLQTINNTVCEHPVAEARLKELFEELFWPKLEVRLKEPSTEERTKLRKRHADDILAEVLDLTRTNVEAIGRLETAITSTKIEVSRTAELKVAALRAKRQSIQMECVRLLQAREALQEEEKSERDPKAVERVRRALSEVQQQLASLRVRLAEMDADMTTYSPAL